MAADAKRVTRPHPQQTVKCPRCSSSETKFCYYNNYSTTQPRYFCKNCKRYWTDGGTLRNVPVGGGLRKNKRSKPKLNPAPSPPPPSASMHQPKASSLTLTDNACGVNHSAIAGHVGFPNSNLDINFGLPHTPNYLLFNPRNYEMDIKAAPVMPLYQPDTNNNQQIGPPFPLPLLAAGYKNDPTFSGACFSAIPWQKEKGTPESLQPGGFMSMTDTPSESYTFNNFINVNDWQQVSEGLLGAGGDDNYALIPPPQRPQWSDFDAGTRL